MAEQPSQNNQDDVTSSQEEAENAAGTVDGQSKPDEENQDLDSFLDSFKEEGTDGENQEESEDDQELSQMISLMESQGPGLAPPETPKSEGAGEGEASDPILEEEEKEGESVPDVGSEGQVPDVTPDGEETGDKPVIQAAADDPASDQVETQEAEADLIAEEETGEEPDEPHDAPVEPSAEAGDDIESDVIESEEAKEFDTLPEGTEVVLDEGSPDQESTILTESESSEQEPESEPQAEEADASGEDIEELEVADSVDALLPTIGLDSEKKPESYAPAIPEGGLKDDGTPVEELVDDRIIDDFRELNRDLKSPDSGNLEESRTRILFIDDNADNLALFKGVLEPEQYDFTDAKNGEEALDILREGDIGITLLNLDIASQDGFELIEEAASDASLSQIPILVNSTSTEHIEKAMRLGASDYFVQPMSVIDVDFQIPIKFKNLLKVRQAELILAGETQSPEVSPTESTGEESSAALAAVPEVETAPPVDENADQEGDLAAAVAEAEPEEDIENLFEDDEDQKLEPEQEDDLAAAVAEAEPEEDIENLFEDDEDDKLEPEQEGDLAAAVAEAEPEEDIENLFEDDEDEKLEPEQEDDLAAAVAEAEPEEDTENLFDDDEDEKLEPEQEDDLAAAVAEAEPEEDIENLFEDDEDEKLEPEQEDDLAAAVAEAEPEEDIENLFEDDEDEKLEPEQEDDFAATFADDEPEDIENLFGDDDDESSLRGKKRQEIASMVAAGAVGATGTRSERNRVESDPTAAEILSEPAGKGSSQIWRSPELARGARKRLAEEGRLVPRKSSKKRLLYGVLAVFLVGTCIWAIWAKQTLTRTGDLTSLFPMPEFLKSEPPEILEPDMATETPPAEPEAAKPEMEIEPIPESLEETVIPETELEDFERARQDVAAPSSGEQRIARTRAAFRETVDRIAASGGSWWSPWKMMRESGETLNELVNDRSREDVLDAFGVDDERVAQNLNRESLVNYLTGKGFNIRGKDAYELSPREIFEVLSMREIKTREGIISILSLLKEKASASREAQAAKWEKIRPSHLAIRSKPLTIESPEISSVVWGSMGTSIQRVHGPGFIRISLQNEITSRGPGLVC